MGIYYNVIGILYLTIISIENQALQIHSMKKKASWAFVLCLSRVQAVILLPVLIVIFLMTGTLMSGCVFRQNDKMETQMKNTETTPIILAAKEE